MVSDKELLEDVSFDREICPRTAEGNFLVSLINKKAFNKQSSVELVECPEINEFLERLIKEDRVKIFSNNPIMVYLTPIGKIIAYGEWCLRRREIKKNIKNKKMNDDKPVCLYYSLDKDKEALDKIVDAGIKCKCYGPLLALKDSPVIFFNETSFYGLSGVKLFIKQWKKINFEKLKIELSEKNERIFREIYQFISRDYSFEKFINNWIEEELFMNGFE